MTKRLFYTVGVRIKEFDNLYVQTVGTFNNLFTECPLKEFDPKMSLEILDPATNNCRVLLVEGVSVTHKMYENLLYNVDKDEYNKNQEKELDEIHGYSV